MSSRKQETNFELFRVAGFFSSFSLLLLRFNSSSSSSNPSSSSSNPSSSTALLPKSSPRSTLHSSQETDLSEHAPPRSEGVGEYSREETRLSKGANFFAATSHAAFSVALSPTNEISTRIFPSLFRRLSFIVNKAFSLSSSSSSSSLAHIDTAASFSVASPRGGFNVPSHTRSFLSFVTVKRKALTRDSSSFSSSGRAVEKTT